MDIYNIKELKRIIVENKLINIYIKHYYFHLKILIINYNLNGWQNINNILEWILLLINYIFHNNNLCIIILLLFVFHHLRSIIRKNHLIWISVGNLIFKIVHRRNFIILIISFLSILLIIRIHRLLSKLIGYKYSNRKIHKLIIILKDLLMLSYHCFNYSRIYGLWMLWNKMCRLFWEISMRIIFKSWRRI